MFSFMYNLKTDLNNNNNKKKKSKLKFKNTRIIFIYLNPKIQNPKNLTETWSRALVYTKVLHN